MPATDEIGFIALPSCTPRLEHTSDPLAIRGLLSKTFGVSGQLRWCEPTLGEAAASAAGDARGLGAYGDRAGGLGCVPTDERRVDSAILAFRRQTVAMLRNLTNLSEALGKRPGNVEASARNSHRLSRTLDDRYGFDAMADTAVRARSHVTIGARRQPSGRMETGQFSATQSEIVPSHVQPQRDNSRRMPSARRRGSCAILLAVMLRRSAAGLVLIAILMSGAAPCAGWQASAQARHDCCAEGMCPDAVGAMPAHGAMSHEAADQCCATSEEKGQRDSSRLVAAFFAVPPPAAADPLPHAEPARSARPPLHEISAALHPTARHVLFSVFLV